jgi:hypothetical protein
MKTKCAFDADCKDNATVFVRVLSCHICDYHNKVHESILYLMEHDVITKDTGHMLDWPYDRLIQLANDCRTCNSLTTNKVALA